MDVINKIISQIKGFWNSLSMVQRFTFTFLALFFVVGAILLGSVFLATDYTALARNLDPGDAGAMVEVLDEEGVSYRLEDDGATIKVPEDEHSRLRLKMSEEGLPRHGVFGYEDLEDTPLGLTESERRLRQKVALEGELVRTIRMYPEVENARVHIASPEETLFNRDDREVTAAVHLDLSSRQELTSNQVESIMNLVAHSVEGLTSEEVVMTSGTEVLSDEVREAEVTTARNEVRQQMNVQAEFQDTLKRSAQSMLEEVLGVGNVIVRVSADLNFDEVQTVSELFQDPVEVSSHEVSEFFEGTGPFPGAVVGDPAVDAPEYPAEETGEQESLYEREETTTNYEVSRIVQEEKEASGDIEGISVAVALDTGVEEEIDEDEEEAIENLVINALGLQIDGRDEVTVEQMPFDTTMEDEWAEEKEQAAQLERRQQLIHTGIWVVALIAAFIIGRRLYRSYQRRQQEQRLREEQAAQVDTGQEKEVPEESESRKQITDLAQSKPDEFVKILRAWLSEE